MATLCSCVRVSVRMCARPCAFVSVNTYERVCLSIYVIVSTAGLPIVDLCVRSNLHFWSRLIGYGNC